MCSHPQWRLPEEAMARTTYSGSCRDFLVELTRREKTFVVGLVLIEHNGDFVRTGDQMRGLELAQEFVVHRGAQVTERVQAGALDRLPRGVKR